MKPPTDAPCNRWRWSSSDHHRGNAQRGTREIDGCINPPAKKAPARAENRPARVQIRSQLGKCRRNAARLPPRGNQAGFSEQESFFGSGSLKPQPSPCDQPEDHCAKRRNKTRCEIAAAVVKKWPRAREEVQEPFIDARAEIGILSNVAQSRSGDAANPAQPDRLQSKFAPGKG